MSIARRERLDRWFAAGIRTASVLVLLAVAGVLLQMIMVARPLFSGGELTPVEPSHISVVDSTGANPAWLPSDLKVWATAERGGKQIWVGISDQGRVVGAQRRADALGPTDWRKLDFMASTEALPIEPAWLLIAPGWRQVMVVATSGLAIHLREGDGVIGSQQLGSGPIEGLQGMSGGNSFLSWQRAELTQWHWLPGNDADGAFVDKLRVHRTATDIERIAVSQQGQRVAIADSQSVSVWHTTSDQTVARLPLNNPVQSLEWRGSTHLSLRDMSGGLNTYELEDHVGAVTLSTLIRTVHYEGYIAPQHRWLPVVSGSAEAKYGIAPLLWGTLKAALVSLFIAVPVGVGAAIFVGFFLSPAMRDRFKPLLELLAAFPSVVLGALTALLIAPHFLDWLPGLFLALIFIPVTVVSISLMWRTGYAGGTSRHRVELLPVILAPVVIAVAAVAFTLGSVWVASLPSVDLAEWLLHTWGVDTVHRNALLIGLVMGVAVVPMVFSLSEDAIHAVPPVLAGGALALGATHWQSYRDVVLPVAAPGIIAACMIGFGRAVGETMIVLLVASNTPLMEINLLEGLRTVSATLALELSEAPFQSVHYRVLFVAGLALFSTTFLLNSLAEWVRLKPLHKQVERL